MKIQIYQRRLAVQYDVGWLRQLYCCFGKV